MKYKVPIIFSLLLLTSCEHVKESVSLDSPRVFCAHGLLQVGDSDIKLRNKYWINYLDPKTGCHVGCQAIYVLKRGFRITDECVPMGMPKQ